MVYLIFEVITGKAKLMMWLSSMWFVLLFLCVRLELWDENERYGFFWEQLYFGVC